MAMLFDELLRGYLDGTLSDADQEELFHIISASTEKRLLFNDYTRLRAMIAADRASEIPPTAVSERAVEAATGIIPPAPVVTGISHTGWIVSAAVTAIGLSIAAWFGYYAGHSSS